MAAGAVPGVQNLVHEVRQQRGLQLDGAALLDAEEDGDWEEGHESVPRGWKIRRSSKNQNQYKSLSKENICLKSILPALQFMNYDCLLAGKSTYPGPTPCSSREPPSCWRKPTPSLSLWQRKFLK